MAMAGLDDIFIANEIVGEAKLRRIAALAKQGVKISFGVDTPCQVEAAESVFAGSRRSAFAAARSSASRLSSPGVNVRFWIRIMRPPRPSRAYQRHIRSTMPIAG